MTALFFVDSKRDVPMNVTFLTVVAKNLAALIEEFKQEFDFEPQAIFKQNGTNNWWVVLDAGEWQVEKDPMPYFEMEEFF